jgi:hypothetical protein
MVFFFSLRDGAGILFKTLSGSKQISGVPRVSCPRRVRFDFGWLSAMIWAKGAG